MVFEDKDYDPIVTNIFSVLSMGMDRLDVHQLHLGSHDQVHVPLVLVVHVERMGSLSASDKKN